MKKFNKFKAFLAISLCCATIFGQVAFATETVEEIENKIDEIQGQKTDVNTQIQANDEKINQKQAEIDELNSQISDTQGQIDDLNYTIYNCTQKIAELEADVKDKEAEIEYDYDVLRKRIRTIYMSGNTSDLEVLLGAKSFDEFIDSASLVKAVSKHDKKLIDGLKDAITQINQDKQDTEVQKSEMVSAKTELEGQKATLDELQIQADAAMQELNVIKGELNTEYQELELAEEEMYAKMEEIIRKQQEEEARRLAEEEARRKAEEEARRKAEEEAAANQNSSDYEEYDYTSDYGDVYVEDRYTPYVWPTPECTVITSYWGDGRNHKGWDFACYGSAYGKSIVSAANGTVTYVNDSDEYGDGWGYYVMVNHGNGYYTLYAHCSGIVVSTGDYVSAGELLGYVGNTGHSYGAHLHFETWYYSTRYDPSTHF